GGGTAAEGRALAVERGAAEWVAGLWRRRAPPPAIARRVVFLVARHRFARNTAAEREQLIADRRRGDLAAHRRHRRFLRPCSGRRLRLRGGAERGGRQSGGESERQRSEATTHANLHLVLPRSALLIDGRGLARNVERGARDRDLSGRGQPHHVDGAGVFG